MSNHQQPPDHEHDHSVADKTVVPVVGSAMTPGELLVQIHVKGMDCSEEVAVVRQALEPLSGVIGLNADVAHGIVTVRISPTGPSHEMMIAAITRSGLGAEAVTTAERIEQTVWTRRWRDILAAVATAAIIAGASWHAAWVGFSAIFTNTDIPWLTQAWYALAIILSVGPLMPRAWGAVRSLRLDMNVLMVIAVIGAISLGDWFEAAAVSTLFSWSLVLEGWTARRAGRAIADLMKSAPKLARVRATASVAERDVPVTEVRSSDVVIVRPGETIPIDGRIVSGGSSINQAPITGESVPVVKTVGATVFAGCVNGEGALEIEMTGTAGDTMLASIARMVAESQQRRGSAERWIDGFARIYTPIILVLAIGVAVIPGAITGNWGWWLYQALILLVIACPCALVISVPVCIVAGIATAARAGIIIKGGAALEIAARLKAIAFDKTGTLTIGRPQVTDVITNDEDTAESIVALAATLESRSEHPVAHAVLARASEMGLKFDAAVSVVAVPGKGIQAANGAWAGSTAWALERGSVNPALRARLEAALAAGSTVIVIGQGDRVLGGIACRDQLRPEAASAIQDLRKTGIQRLIMLSGDAEVVAHHVAQEVGLTESYGSLLPDAKVEKIALLTAEVSPMAMVGDGLNDAPALARANLGIAMGSATAATLETADVALLTNDLRRLPWLVHHARQVMAIMRQNVVASLATKLLFIGLAIAGHGSMWLAIAADTGVSLLVVLNALRLLR